MKRVRFASLLAISFFIILTTQAQEVRIWQTLFDDGTARENKLGINDYQANQNEGFVLLKELPSRKFAASSVASERSISVDPTRTFHTIQGIGAAMTDSSAWVLSQLKVKNPDLYTHVMVHVGLQGAFFSVYRTRVFLD
ncbi:hypothetical protein N9B73_13275 [Verrucomicrobiales bacterium]|nr:hypothetical protein [Verrucomicrobiales bacterium]